MHFTTTNLSDHAHSLDWLVQTMSTCQSQIKPGFHYDKHGEQKMSKWNHPFRHEVGTSISPSSVVLLNGYEISLLISWFTLEKNSKNCKGYWELCWVENSSISYFLISSSHFSPNSKFLVIFTVKYILWFQWFGKKNGRFKKLSCVDINLISIFY